MERRVAIEKGKSVRSPGREKITAEKTNAAILNGGTVGRAGRSEPDRL